MAIFDSGLPTVSSYKTRQNGYLITEDYQFFSYRNSIFSSKAFKGSNSSLGEFPKWSPDETMVVFHSSHSGNREVYVMNLDSRNIKQLTHNEAEDSFPSWSPDGSKIVFQSNRDGNHEIYVMNADGTNQTRLTENTASDTLPVW